MLKQKIRKILKVVGVLTDPHPQFVSLVGHGANQTPFAVTKIAEHPLDGDADMKLTKSEILERVQQGAASVQRFEFAAPQFTTVKDVEQYLTDNDYEGFEVTKSGDSFSVEALPADGFSMLGEIEMQGGVKLFVGTPIEVSDDTTEKDAGEKSSDSGEPETGEGKQAAEGESSESSQKEDDKETDADEGGDKAAATQDEGDGTETVSKFDEFMAFWSNATDLNGVLADGADGLPPGFYDVTQAMITATKNALLAGDNEAVKTIMDQFADMVIKMAKALSAATVPKSVAEKMINDPAQKASSDADQAADLEPEKTSEDSAQGIDGQDLMATIKASIEAAMVEGQKPLLDRFDGVEKATQSVAEQVSAITGRVDSLENTASARKSEDVDGKQAKDDNKRAPISRAARNTLGFANTGAQQ